MSVNGAAAEQSINEVFEQTAFLYDGNAAYIENLQARYQIDPNSVDADWRDFFHHLNDDDQDVRSLVGGPAWKPRYTAQTSNPELTAAMDGNWGRLEELVGDKIQGKAAVVGAGVSEAEVLRAARDSTRALMMIRAYRVRGHLHADLDPLGLQRPRDHEDLNPES
jgi:2-oxoglutarate dehydrogenase E1 component